MSAASRGSVLAVASVLANGEGPDRLTLSLVACRDAYRWYDDEGVSREVGGRTVEEAIAAARETWPARDGWDFRVDA